MTPYLERRLKDLDDDFKTLIHLLKRFSLIFELSEDDADYVASTIKTYQTDVTNILKEIREFGEK